MTDRSPILSSIGLGMSSPSLWEINLYRQQQTWLKYDIVFAFKSENSFLPTSVCVKQTLPFFNSWSVRKLSVEEARLIHFSKLGISSNCDSSAEFNCMWAGSLFEGHTMLPQTFSPDILRSSGFQFQDEQFWWPWKGQLTLGKPLKGLQVSNEPIRGLSAAPGRWTPTNEGPSKVTQE